MRVLLGAAFEYTLGVCVRAACLKPTRAGCCMPCVRERVRVRDTVARVYACVCAALPCCPVQATIERLKQQRSQVERLKWESRQQNATIQSLRAENQRLDAEVCWHARSCRQRQAYPRISDGLPIASCAVYGEPA